MLSLKKTYYLLFFIGLFFFPFNSFEGLKFLGEYKNEAGAYIFLTGFLLLFIDFLRGSTFHIPLNKTIFLIILVFLLWTIIGLILNINTVLGSYFKHTTGLNRFIRQFISLLFSAIFFQLFFWNILVNMTVKQILFKIRKVFFISLLFATIYGLIELFVNVFKISFLLPVYQLFNYFPFLQEDFHTLGRISSIAFEPPFLAVFLISISGWMFSYMLTNNNGMKYIPTIMVLILTYYSGSRTALIVILIQLIFFLNIYLTPIRKKLVLSSVILLVFCGSVFAVLSKDNRVIKDIAKKIESLDFVGNLTKNVSNQSRFGIQYSSIQVFKSNPIIGVGFGQQSFTGRYLYPAWAVKNNWEFKYIYQNNNEKSFPPGYNLYTRLLAETGIIGISIFLFLMITTFKHTRSLMRESDFNLRIIGIILFITLIGIYINWLQIDTFRVYIFWLSLCILMKLSYKNKKINVIKN
uniref:O-antigen ligase family protein n=1 Tax=Flavobacterium sp. TaxID=239 RepID=UPI00404BA394